MSLAVTDDGRYLPSGEMLTVHSASIHHLQSIVNFVVFVVFKTMRQNDSHGIRPVEDCASGKRYLQKRRGTDTL